jgi:hypothetical protein
MQTYEALTLHLSIKPDFYTNMNCQPGTSLVKLFLWITPFTPPPSQAAEPQQKKIGNYKKNNILSKLGKPRIVYITQNIHYTPRALYTCNYTLPTFRFGKAIRALTQAHTNKKQRALPAKICLALRRQSDLYLHR